MTDEIPVEIGHKFNPRHRSDDIKMQVYEKLKTLETPVSIALLARSVHASRIPVERNVREFLHGELKDLIGLIRIGSADVLYRKVTKV